MKENNEKNFLPLACLAILCVLVIFSSLLINKFLKTEEPASLTGGYDIDNGDTKINWQKYKSISLKISDSYEITQSGTYHLSGKINDGLITINAGDDNGVVKLILDNIEINNESGPAIFIKSADDVIIETAENSSNLLISGENFVGFDEKVDAAIYSMSDLSFYGNGTLYIESKYKDGIVSKDDLTIRSGNIEIETKEHGIVGKDSVHIVDGNIKIDSKQDGIKSTNEEKTTKGFVYIENGNIEINAGDDGIHATSFLVIDNGTIDIKESYEGLEGGMVVINDGKISIISVDDGINVAGGEDESSFMRPGSQAFTDSISHILTINNGDIYINATGDGLDSNGSIYINGGKIVIDGPTNSGNGALDSEFGIFLNGDAEVVAIGSSGMAEGFNENSAVNSVNIYLDSAQSRKTQIAIKNSKNETILSHTSAKTFDCIIFGSNKIKLSETYYLYINGTKVNSFTVSGLITNVGDARNNLGQPIIIPNKQNIPNINDVPEKDEFIEKPRDEKFQKK